MPKVELWLGNEKKTLQVPYSQLSDYIYMYEPPEPPTYCGDPGPPQEATFKILCYKITGWREDPHYFERIYQATLVE